MHDRGSCETGSLTAMASGVRSPTQEGAVSAREVASCWLCCQRSNAVEAQQSPIVACAALEKPAGMTPP
jgi:hypothetical protein